MDKVADCFMSVLEFHFKLEEPILARLEAHLQKNSEFGEEVAAEFQKHLGEGPVASTTIVFEANMGLFGPLRKEIQAATNSLKKAQTFQQALLDKIEEGRRQEEETTSIPPCPVSHRPGASRKRLRELRERVSAASEPGL
eukprot:CAMPEP_0114654730 /NCGR_PEP_ID=MMETSP0191-20121206/10649_1 /TAXON_ID=126664 /ORGANISM="Sorites sp." /LENGTH=139 /DNA_ID=CAMNT_0001870263 /DNA_START=241 /DNA_END=657 /DNA_ORIENTATION=-